MVEFIDFPVFRTCNMSWSNPVLDMLMPFITELGSRHLIFIIAVILLIFYRRKDRGRLGLLLLAGITVTYYIVSALKGIIARPRPFVVIQEANLLCEVSRSFSFPSGHTTTAFMAATILADTFRRWRVPLYVLAILVAFSRIYLGVHFLSDVAAGSILGIMIGYMLIKIECI